MIWSILIIGLLLRLVSLNQSLWLDEAINIVASQKYSLLGMVTQYAVGDFHPPGWFFVLWSWGKLFGYSEIALRLPSVIFGVLTIYVTYLIGKKLLSKNLGLTAALLLSINPLHIYYSQDARMYALAALAVAVNIFLLIKTVKGEKVHLTLLIISNFAVLISDYVSYFIFPAQLIFLLFFRKKEIIKRWIIAFIGGLALSIWWLPTFLMQLDSGAVTSSQLPTWKFVVGGFNFKTIPLTFVKIIIGRISLTDKIVYAAVLLPVCSLFIYLLWRGAKLADSLSKKLLLAWIVIPVIVATIISVVIPVYNYFRLLFIIPAFVTLTAYGILSFKDKLRYGILAGIVLIEVFCALVYLLNPLFQREDWRGLVNYFKEKQSAVILFESSGTLPPFDYYAKGSLNGKGALKDFPVKDESSVANLEDLIGNNKEVYLVDYLIQISDPNRLVAKRLEDSGYRKVDTKDFHGVGFVYHYVRDN